MPSEFINEPAEHVQLRYLVQEANQIVLPMSPDERKEWVAESLVAEEIDSILELFREPKK